MKKTTKCPTCGGHLVYEECGTYGDCFKINKRTGKVSKERFRRVHYEHGDSMLYCLKCGSNFDFKLNADGTFYIYE